jgi:hypothetical protein
MPRFKLSHPDEVDAIQVTGDNSEAVKLWDYSSVKVGSEKTAFGILVRLVPSTGSSWMPAEPEQWLVRDSRGWISVMDNDAFHAMYEPTETPA